jgi:hypothetical protein
MRGILAGVLIAVGLLLVPFASQGVWVERELLSTRAFTTLATEVLAQDAVRDALANRIADELEQQVSQVSLVRFALVPALREALDTEQFRTIFERAVGDLHSQLQRGDDELKLDLDAMLPLVRDLVSQVPLVGEGVASEIPDGVFPAFTVVTKENVPQLWVGVEATQGAWWLFPVLALGFLGAGVAVARRRAVAIVVVGLGIALVAVVLVLALRLGRDPLSEVAGPTVEIDAFKAGYDTVTDSLAIQTMVLGLAGLVVAAIGMGFVIVGRRTPRARPAL